MPRTATPPRQSTSTAGGRKLLPREVHKRGCPMIPDRTEWFDTHRPVRQGGGLITVVRCVDCGNAEYRNPDGSVAADIDPNQGGSYGPMEVNGEVSLHDPTPEPDEEMA